MSTTYTTKQGDTWDQISYAIYGSETHIDWLVSNNLPLLDNFVFSAGVTLQTPAMPKDYTAISVPTWRVSP